MAAAAAAAAAASAAVSYNSSDTHATNNLVYHSKRTTERLEALNNHIFFRSSSVSYAFHVAPYSENDMFGYFSGYYRYYTIAMCCRCRCYCYQLIQSGKRVLSGRSLPLIWYAVAVYFYFGDQIFSSIHFNYEPKRIWNSWAVDCAPKWCGV